MFGIFFLIQFWRILDASYSVFEIDAFSVETTRQGKFTWEGLLEKLHSQGNLSFALQHWKILVINIETHQLFTAHTILQLI